MMRSKKVINAVTITLLVFYFILIMGSTPIIARFFIFTDDKDNCDFNSAENEPVNEHNDTLAVVPPEHESAHISNGDNRSEESTCSSDNTTQSKLKLALALVFALCLPCLLILLVKIARTVKTQNSKDTEFQMKDIMELAAVSKDKADTITQEQQEVIKQMVYNTWIYDNRLGRDSMALRHQALQVKQIVRVNNQHLWKLYQKGHSSIGSTEYPEELRENPILTMERCHQQNQAQADSSHGRLEGSHNDLHDTEVAGRQQMNGVEMETEHNRVVQHEQKHLEVVSNVAGYDHLRQGSAEMDVLERESMDGHSTGTVFANSDQCNNMNAVYNRGTSARQQGNKANEGHKMPTNTQDTVHGDNFETEEQNSQHSREIPHNTYTHGNFTGQAVMSSGDTNETTSFTTNVSVHTMFNLSSNEVYLFHGTKLANIPDILQKGFKLRKARKGLYGKAIYLAESSEKADQYTDNFHNRRPQNLAMLVVRVALGGLHCHEREETVNHTQFPPKSVILAGMHKRFREFLVFDSKILYPEFVVFYDRK